MPGRSCQNFSLSLKSFCRTLENFKLIRLWSSSRRGADAKTLPKLVYLHSPWTFLQTKYQFFKLRWLWDQEFIEDEFLRGAKQSVVVLTDSIRSQDGMEIGNYATPVGFNQITRDMILSRNDIRLKLVKFRVEDIQRALPMKVSLLKRAGRKNCLVDVVFVGMRNTRDFNDPQESQFMTQHLRQLDREMKTSSHILEVPHRIVFAEIYMRFYRDYAPSVLQNWAVSFYKIISFDILNYFPK